MKCDLTGKTALVTGSSRGIGSAIAKELALGGAKVFIHYAGNIESAKKMQDELKEIGAECEVVQADLTNPDECKALKQAVGEVDLLVLNASVQIKKDWLEITKEDFDTQVYCNFYSSLSLIQEFVPNMKKNKFGRIITIGSVQETKPHPQMLVYSATKAAQTNMVKSLALQLAEFNITVNNIAPGVIYTDRNKTGLRDMEYAKKVMDSIPLRFYGEKEDCAGIVRLICSEEGRYITGQSIYVDGGKSL